MCEQIFQRIISIVTEDKEYIKKSLTRQRIWYNLKQLSEAGVGIPVPDLNDLEDFDFTIPSNYAVNSEKHRPTLVGDAEEQKDLFSQ